MGRSKEVFVADSIGDKEDKTSDPLDEYAAIHGFGCPRGGVAIRVLSTATFPATTLSGDSVLHATIESIIAGIVRIISSGGASARASRTDDNVCTTDAVMGELNPMCTADARIVMLAITATTAEAVLASI